MATTQSTTKFFYPPRPGSGAATFSDNIVGLQTVEGGGLTQGNFEFTTSVVEKVNRTFNVGAFSEPINLEGLDIDNLVESRRIMATQFRVYPNYDVSQVLNFSMYGSLSKRFQVSVTEIIHRFPASLDIVFNNDDFVTGATATNISYDSTTSSESTELSVGTGIVIGVPAAVPAVCAVHVGDATVPVFFFTEVTTIGAALAGVASVPSQRLQPLQERSS